jgi:hypothetical protein
MGLRGTEDCHNPIALRLVDDAFVPTHGFSHDIENWPEPLHSQLGITQAVDKTR